MTADDFETAARTEAERRYVITPDYWGPTTSERVRIFWDGSAWARDHLATQEPTDAEVQALGRGLNEAGWTCQESGDNPGFYSECEDCRRVCDDLARDALIRARAARRDEEQR